MQFDNKSIPLWIKVATTFFALSIGVVLILSFTSPQQVLFGLPVKIITIASLGFLLFLLLILIFLWFFPNSRFALSLYWLIRFFRELICIIALLGIVYLLAIRTPLFSLRGGIPLINLILLFMLGLLVQPAALDESPLPGMKDFNQFLQKLSDRINSIPVLLLSVAVALLPALIVFSIIYFGLNASLSDYGPFSFWNDETGYWVWLRSFSHEGLNVGYNSPNELTSPASFSRYGEGSPFFVYFYGAITWIVGWSSHLPILINIVILTLAVLLFIHLTKLEPVQILFTGLILILTWPIVIYLPMTTPETLNQAIGFILAAGFFRLLTQRDEVSLPARILFIVLIFLAALIRLSWGLLLIPAFFYTLNGSILRRAILAVLLGAGLYISSILITNFFLPPINNSILLNIKGSLAQGPQVLFGYVSFQFKQMFKFRQLNPNMAVMLQIVIILGWNLIRLARMIRLKPPIERIAQSRSVFDIYNVGTLATAGLLFYIQEGFYRTFTPQLLIVYLLQAAKKDYRFLVTLLTINLMFFHSYMTYYARVGDAAIIKADYTTEFSEGRQLQSEIEKLISFDRSTQNPWCNTLLIPLNYYDYRLTILPPEFGISYILDIDTIKTPLKSKYLLFDQDTYHELSGRLHVKLLQSFSIGDLYYNMDSGCEFDS